MRVGNQKDFVAGLLFTVVGVAFALGARHYPVGTAARMGPGYFPMLLGVLLAVLGVAIALKAVLRRGDAASDGAIGPWAWRPLLMVLSANFAFGVLLVGLPGLGIPSMGLVVAIYALVLLASLATRPVRWGETLGLATVLAVGSYLVFIRGLGLVLPVWPQGLHS
ncbi:Tripartite tricarboxylate transporter TctB family protein [Lampropedia hyalina DSM 16112]|uniref:Tripartite tricarboxylate transporter TctB family protein n=1 Tax=Lampropedia hyalina DSM 16112 TaxID=1122156 RepID=A0A1M4SCE8_9BURK|nr:tripartite tricarboxylate transporter TctB family protein [Lampropedia hyalina]SHE29838.1 Tripartite tricarboxylate transporter TctB family protein [Lampropedia hyalina DSM 16112]